MGIYNNSANLGKSVNYPIFIFKIISSLIFIILGIYLIVRKRYYYIKREATVLDVETTNTYSNNVVVALTGDSRKCQHVTLHDSNVNSLHEGDKTHVYINDAPSCPKFASLTPDDTRGTGVVFIIIAFLSALVSDIQFRIVQKSKLAGAAVGAKAAYNIATDIGI